MTEEDTIDNIDRRTFVKAAGATAGTGLVPSRVLANKSPITKTHLLEIQVSYEITDVNTDGAPAGVMINEPRGHEVGDQQIYITKQAPEDTLSKFENNDLVVRGERRKGQGYIGAPATVAGGEPDVLPTEILGTRPTYGIRTKSVSAPTVEVATDGSSPVVTAEGERIPTSSGQVTKRHLDSRKASVVFVHTLDKIEELQGVEKEKWPLKREETIVTTEATPVVHVTNRGKCPVVDLTDHVSSNS